jgi:hypothetical protein
VARDRQGIIPFPGDRDAIMAVHEKMLRGAILLV